jgi:hypothetical protein
MPAMQSVQIYQSFAGTIFFSRTLWLFFFFSKHRWLTNSIHVSTFRRHYSWDEYSVKDSHLLLKYAGLRGGIVKELLGGANLLGALKVSGIIGSLVLVNSNFRMRKGLRKFSAIWARALENFASHILGRKILSIGFNVYQNIDLSGAPTCLGPALVISQNKRVLNHTVVSMKAHEYNFTLSVYS